MNTPGQSTVAATLDAIEAATAPRCGHCNAAIPAGCASDDFCCEGCQRAWAAVHHGAQQLASGWNDAVSPAPRRPDGPSWTHAVGILGDLSVPAITVEIAAAPDLFLEAINRRLVAGMERMHAEIAAAFRQLGEAVSLCAEHLHPLLTEQPPTDPMQRALWLRRNRNTGPRPRGRAPQRIDPTGERVCRQARRTRRGGQR